MKVKELSPEDKKKMVAKAKAHEMLKKLWPLPIGYSLKSSVASAGHRDCYTKEKQKTTATYWKEALKK